MWINDVKSDCVFSACLVLKKRVYKFCEEMNRKITMKIFCGPRVKRHFLHALSDLLFALSTLTPDHWLDGPAKRVLRTKPKNLSGF